MRHSTPAFRAWQDAEQLARQAEARLFEKLRDREHPQLPTREDLEQARALRLVAHRRMREMLQEMQHLADMLRIAPRGPRVIAVRPRV